jgi:Outer membrane lipoprotein carrier protein LolA-like
MIRRLAVALLLVLTVPASAGAQSVRVLLRPGENLSGRFDQQLQRAGSMNSLESHGNFVLSLDKGLVWQIEKPVAATVVITPNDFAQWVNGKEVQHVPVAKIPVLGELYALLAASLGGDRTALATMFSVSEQDDGSNWRLVLRPLSANDLIAKQVQSVTVTGDRFLRTVVIQRANGDVQTTTFSGHSLSTGPLPAEDQALLDATGQ